MAVKVHLAGTSTTNPSQCRCVFIPQPPSLGWQPVPGGAARELERGCDKGMEGWDTG